MNKNLVKLTFSALPENQGFARNVAAAYIAQLDPTVAELTEVKTVVSEAVSNAIIHGYGNSGKGEIQLEMALVSEDRLMIVVRDFGIGINDITRAMEPLYTTCETPELSGMGFTVMESFADKVQVDSKVGSGTTVSLYKTLERYYGK